MSWSLTRTSIFLVSSQPPQIVIKYACFGECDNERFVGTRGKKKDNSYNDSARARLYESVTEDNKRSDVFVKCEREGKRKHRF